MINYCEECYKKTFHSETEYKIRLAEAIYKKETLLCYHTYYAKRNAN